MKDRSSVNQDQGPQGTSLFKTFLNALVPLVAISLVATGCMPMQMVQPVQNPGPVVIPVNTETTFQKNAQGWYVRVSPTSTPMPIGTPVAKPSWKENLRNQPYLYSRYFDIAVGAGARTFSENPSGSDQSDTFSTTEKNYVLPEVNVRWEPLWLGLQLKVPEPTVDTYTTSFSGKDNGSVEVQSTTWGLLSLYPPIGPSWFEPHVGIGLDSNWSTGTNIVSPNGSLLPIKLSSYSPVWQAGIQFNIPDNPVTG